MASTPSDLAEFRLLRALRAGQPGAFPSLWNAQAGASWSVFRALCDTDAEAIGWMASFRLDLSERAVTFAPAEALAPQMGRALLDHVGEAFADDSPMPHVPLAPDESGLRRLPRRTRLHYLVDLFFDHTVADENVREAYRLLEPSQDTDARLLVHAALMRNPPAQALILPPGVDLPAPPPSAARRGVLLIGATGALLLALLPLIIVLLGDPGARHPGRLHGDTLAAAEGVILDGDPVMLGVRLSRNGAPGILTEVPDLAAQGLTLLGARVQAGVVVLLYRSAEAEWTLQHFEGNYTVDGAVVAESGDLRAYEVGGAIAVRWPGAGSTWVLVGRVEPAQAIEAAAGIVARP